MKCRAAVLTGPGRPFEVVELDVDEPGPGEVLVRFVASGLCHSDLHLVDGEVIGVFPLVAGHEGAGVVERVGPGVTRVQAGDHIVCSFIPSCGVCRYCSTGRQNLCDLGAHLLTGVLPGHEYRAHRDGVDYGLMCLVGTFAELGTISEYSVVKVPDHIPLETAALVGCGVPTGWGAAVYTGGVGVGDTVIVYGIGGVGINAVQGALHAGARHVIAVDPVEFKRETACTLGATHAVATAREAKELVRELTRGQGADHALVTVGIVDTEVVESAFFAVGKGGTVVVVGMAHPRRKTINVSSEMLTVWEKRIVGSLFGSASPQYDIPRLLELHADGRLRLDELITTRYSLDQINEGYEDMRAGRNIRGLIVHGT